MRVQWFPLVFWCQIVGYCCALSIQQPDKQVILTDERRICLIDDSFPDEARLIASSLSIPISSDMPECLEYSTHALRLVPFESGDVSTYALGIEALDNADAGENSRRRKPKQKKKPAPFYIDLCPPKSSRMGKRGAKESGTDLLVKAVSPKRASSDGRDGAIVYDLTAGFGQDSLVLALGRASEVYMVERDPVVGALLEDALRRIECLAASQTSPEKELASELSCRLRLKTGETKDMAKWMTESKDVPDADVVYLDPMFPPRTKSAPMRKA